MAADDNKPTVKQRLSGQGLSDTLKREKHQTRKHRRRDRRPVAGVEVLPDRAVDQASSGVREAGDRETSRAVAGSVPDIDAGAIAEAKAAEARDAETPQAMAARLYTAFAGQMDQLEARLNEVFATAGDNSGAGLQEIDKTVKTLASLAKTLSALMDLKSEAMPDGEEASQDDPDALRAELAQRLEALCPGRPT